MVFDGAPHVSPLRDPEHARAGGQDRLGGQDLLADRVEGRLGVAAPPLADAIAGQHQFLTFTTATPLQWAVAEGLALPAEWHAAHRAQYAAARAGWRGAERGGLCLLPRPATWFVTVDLAASGLRARRRSGGRTPDPRGRGRLDPGLAPSTATRPKGYLRLCFAKQDATLDAAIERLARLRTQE